MSQSSIFVPARRQLWFRLGCTCQLPGPHAFRVARDLGDTGSCTSCGKESGEHPRQDAGNRFDGEFLEAEGRA